MCGARSRLTPQVLLAAPTAGLIRAHLRARVAVRLVSWISRKHLRHTATGSAQFASVLWLLRVCRRATTMSCPRDMGGRTRFWRRRTERTWRRRHHLMDRACPLCWLDRQAPPRRKDRVGRIVALSGKRYTGQSTRISEDRLLNVPEEQWWRYYTPPHSASTAHTHRGLCPSLERGWCRVGVLRTPGLRLRRTQRPPLSISRRGSR